MDHPTDAASDQALVRAWEHGDERGYDTLVTRYAPVVFARCRRALGATDAEDATQAVFLVLARKRAQASASPALAAWLLTVADHVIRNARRDLARRRRAEATAPCPPTTVEAPMHDIQDHLDAAMADLTAAERTAVQLHLLAGHTLAEVAVHVGAPVSTVHGRVQRGLERLRDALAKRGVTTSVLLLMTALVGESSAGVPPAVMVRLRDPTAAGGGVGATSVASARTLRWSRHGLTSMHKLALTGATFLLAVSATYSLIAAADPLPNPTNGLTVATKVQSDPASSPLPASSGSKLTYWLGARLVDGVRSAQRLQALPEMELLPPEVRQQVLAVLASTKHASVVMEMDDPAANERKNLLATVRGWLEATDANAPVLTWARAQLGAPESDARNRYLIGGDKDQARISFVGTRILVSPSADALEVPDVKSPVEMFREQTAMPHDLAIEITTADQNGKPIVPTQISLGIQDDGVRLSHRSMWSGDREGQEKAQRLMALPVVDVTRFGTLPADTIVAATVALTSESSRASSLFAWIGAPASANRSEVVGEAGQAQGNGTFSMHVGPHGPEMMLAASNDETQARLMALRRALEQVDGAITVWVQPGTPIPVLSVAVDLPQKAADDLMLGLGLPVDDAGMARYGQMCLMWRAGRLVVTNHPLGPDGVIESGGFTDHNDVKTALAAMSAPSQCKAILRPNALMNQVQGFAPLVMSAEQQRQFSTYQQRVQDGKAYAFLSLGANSQGFFLDAGGLLAMIAGMAIGQMTVDPALLIQAIN